MKPDEMKKAIEDLMEFSTHDEACARVDGTFPCNCGLKEAREKALAAVKYLQREIESSI